MAARLYAYVGSATIRATASPTGIPIHSAAQLHTWVSQQEHAVAGMVPATFVIDPAGRLLLAARHSEHVACAGGQPVQTAGEMFFCLRPLRLAEVTNQSTGYCPEPESWLAVAAALDALPLPHPGRFSHALAFRRCDVCCQTNIIKDGWQYCACCDAALSKTWNFRYY